LECEAGVGLHLEANLFGDSFPMTNLHTISAESHAHGDALLEIDDFLFDDFSDFLDLRNVLFFELTDALVHDLIGVVDDFFHFKRIKFVELIMEPRFVHCLPLVGSGPQVREGFVVFDHLVDVVVGGFFVASKGLTVVKDFSRLVGLLEGLPNLLGFLGNFLKLIHVGVLGKADDSLVDFDDFVVELGLLLLHFIHHLVLFFLELATLNLHHLVGLTGGAIKFLLALVLFVVCEREAK
jgi:hypothetical protein